MISHTKHELLKAFPTELENDVMIVLRVIIQKEKLDFSHCFDVELCGNKLCIPERIYYNEPLIITNNSLTDRQQIILLCLFTRHHDGFIREESLSKIIHRCNDYNWIIPYVIRLIGEYVIEILQVVKLHIKKVNKSSLKDFIEENAEFYQTIESRMMSYWNCYYRREYPNKKDYVGFEILAYFHT